jgi:regulator of RNase E activity RraA
MTLTSISPATTQQDERMLTEQRNPCAAQADSGLIAAFRNTPTPLISDNLGRLAGAVALRAYHRHGRLGGTALTVRTRTGDNLAIHEALDLVRPGDVVVDAGGDTNRAVVGEIMKAIAEHKGAAGFVIDGAIRDAACFAALRFSLLRPRRRAPRSLQERTWRHQRPGCDPWLRDRPR